MLSVEQELSITDLKLPGASSITSSTIARESTQLNPSMFQESSISIHNQFNAVIATSLIRGVFS